MPKMNLTRWDTLLFETSSADRYRFIRFQGKSGFFAEVWDNKAIEPHNEEESVKYNVKEKKKRKK